MPEEISSITSSSLRKVFGGLPLKEKYEALETLLELLDAADDYEIKIPPEENAQLHGDDRLALFERELESAPEKVREMFLRRMVQRGNLRLLNQAAALTVVQDPVDLDPSILTMEMSQADRFRLSALILESENPGVAFCSKTVEQRILNEWLEQQDGAALNPVALPDHLSFSNLSKTTKDLERSEDIDCVENLPRGSRYRLSTKGHALAVKHAQTLSSPLHETKRA
ncbi:MAG: hypothetical protein P1U89_26260 [Verrucomicrobiales bacterium]|nr:hypothetical protein [Verrucomicrobiales bacterium]